MRPRSTLAGRLRITLLSPYLSLGHLKLDVRSDWSHQGFYFNPLLILKKKIKKITQAREGRYPVRLAVAISEGDFHRI